MYSTLCQAARKGFDAGNEKVRSGFYSDVRYENEIPYEP